MQLQLSTPALLFPTISLLLLAYNNRFLTIATLIRSLKSRFLETQDASIIPQISNLRRRLFLIRNMQVVGISAMFGCVLSMFLIYEGNQRIANVVFVGSLIALLVSLSFSIREILLSTTALNLELKTIEEHLD